MIEILFLYLMITQFVREDMCKYAFIEHHENTKDSLADLN